MVFKDPLYVEFRVSDPSRLDALCRVVSAIASAKEAGSFPPLDRWRDLFDDQALARLDESSIVVYQAFRPDVARYAATTGRFGTGFQLDRMSWIKPNFLWMMYRCGWATKPGQESVLAVRLRREHFEQILAVAVHS